MTIVLDVSFDHQQSSSNNDSQRSAIKECSGKKAKDKQKDNASSSKAALKVAKVKTKVSHVRINFNKCFVWHNKTQLRDFRL